MLVSYRGFIQKVSIVLESHEHVPAGYRIVDDGILIKSLKQSYDTGVSVTLYHSTKGFLAHKKV